MPADRRTDTIERMRLKDTPHHEDLRRTTSPVGRLLRRLR